jgi:hypothetical protein
MEQKALIQQLMRQNDEAAKRYEELQKTLINTALNSLMVEPGGFGPPKHTLTGDTTVGDDQDDPEITTASPSRGKPSDDKSPSCICGGSTLENGHISERELRIQEQRIINLLEKIELARKRLGDLGFSSIHDCEQAQRKLESTTKALEGMLILQMEALVNKTEPVLYQEQAEQVEQAIEEGNVELTKAILHARRRRRWNIFSSIWNARPKSRRTSTYTEAPASKPTIVHGPMIRISPDSGDVEAPAAAGQDQQDESEKERIRRAEERLLPDAGEASDSVRIPSLDPPARGSVVTYSAPETAPQKREVDDLILEWTTLDSSQV